MPERAIKTFDTEAQEYFIRGMSAARGGQRTMAARLLREAVRLNPYHEQAWLWLSSVLDDQDDVIYCLRSVLDINPQNQPARVGLEKFAIAPPQTDAPLIGAWDDETFTSYTRVQQGAPSWWMQWREAKTIWGMVRRTVWIIPLLLIGTTIVLRTILALQPLPYFPTYRDLEAPLPTVSQAAGALPARTATELSESSSQATLQRAALDRYWRDIATIRSELQAATSLYRQQTAQSYTTVDRAAAARVLVEKLDRAQTALAVLLPPPGTRNAHTSYVEGLTEERQGIEDLLTFYSNDEVIYANRAGVRLQTARIKISEAVAAWNQYARETATVFGGNVPETGR